MTHLLLEPLKTYEILNMLLRFNVENTPKRDPSIDHHFYRELSIQFDITHRVDKGFEQRSKKPTLFQLGKKQ